MTKDHDRRVQSPNPTTWKEITYRVIVPLIIGVMGSLIVIGLVWGEIKAHIRDEDVHMPFEKKSEKFIPRPEHELAMNAINTRLDQMEKRVDKRFDKMDEMQNKIYDELLKGGN